MLIFKLAALVELMLVISSRSHPDSPDRGL